MDHSLEYGQYLDKEIAHCDSRYACCQDLESLLHSEMTNLQRRMEQLVADKKRLQQARELFSDEHPFQTKTLVLYTHSNKIARETLELQDVDLSRR